MRSLLMNLPLLASLLCSACQRIPLPAHPVNPVAKAPRKLLFVGNSFTYYNGGLENNVKRLADSARPPRRLDAARATQGGATLKILDGKQWVHDQIDQGGYDVVILQEDIPELTEHSVEPFFTYARRFDEEIKRAGGQTVLFMAWPYERLNWVTLEQISRAHHEVGRELDVPVAPVGVAFQRAMQARPHLSMLGRDKEHETIHGTYLAACVIYATLFRQSPKGLTYHPTGISAEEAAFLQRIAWDTVKEWKKQR
jgi:hypothetical protein